MGMVQDFAALDGLLAKDRMSFGDFEDELIHQSLKSWALLFINHSKQMKKAHVFSEDSKNLKVTPDYGRTTP